VAVGVVAWVAVAVGDVAWEEVWEVAAWVLVPGPQRQYPRPFFSHPKAQTNKTNSAY